MSDASVVQAVHYTFQPVHGRRRNFDQVFTFQPSTAVQVLFRKGESRLPWELPGAWRLLRSFTRTNSWSNPRVAPVSNAFSLSLNFPRAAQ